MDVRYVRRYIGCVVLCVVFFAAVSGCNGGTQSSQSTKVSPLRNQAAWHTKTSANRLLFPEKEILGRYLWIIDDGDTESLELKSDHIALFYQNIVLFSLPGEDAPEPGPRSKGTWRLVGDVLLIHNENPREIMLPDARYIPVKWGSHYFLVDENVMPGFCAGIGKTDSYWRGFFKSCYSESRHMYIKEGDGRFYGEPFIPERYRDFYENGQIVARVKRLTGGGHAIINKGSVDRVKPGMLFCSSDHSAALVDCEVVSTRQHESEVRPIYYHYSKSLVKVGMLFTTGDYINRPMETDYPRFKSLVEAKKAAKQAFSRH